MSSHEKVRLTLEERLALAAQSRASSPEAATALVRQFAELPAAYAFCGKSDVEALFELTDDCWEDPRVDIDSYRGFCPVLLAAMEHDNASGRLSRRPVDLELRRPVWGTRVNNSLILLGEMLMDHTMGRWHNQEVYHCLRMTLGQYLDVLTGSDFRRSESEEEWFQFWRTDFSNGCIEDQPLAEVLAGILRRYMVGWRVFDRLDHVLRCLGGLAFHLEQAGTRYDVSPDPDIDAAEGDISLLMEVSRTEDAAMAHRLRMELRQCGIGRNLEELPCAEADCPDPQGYFLTLAQEYAPELPDPGSEMEAKTLRGQAFLPDWAHWPSDLRDLAKESPFPEFGALLEECLDPNRLADAMREINAAVIDLYMLWIEPYLWMKKAA